MLANVCLHFCFILLRLSLAMFVSCYQSLADLTVPFSSYHQVWTLLNRWMQILMHCANI